MSKDRGFSLLEVIIALFILSTTALGFMRVTQTSVEAARDLEVRYLASIVADNQLVEIFGEDIPVRIGVETGTESQHGRAFDWQREVSQSERQGVFQIEVEVRPAGGERVLAILTALKAELVS